VKAIVTKAFIGRRDDSAESENLQVGAEITGDLARAAVEQGNAEPEGGRKPKKKGKDVEPTPRADLEKLADEKGIAFDADTTDEALAALIEAAGA